MFSAHRGPQQHKRAGMVAMAGLAQGLEHEHASVMAMVTLAEDLEHEHVGVVAMVDLAQGLEHEHAGVATMARLVAGIDDTRPAEIAGLTTVRVRIGELGAAAALAVVEGRSPTESKARDHEIVVRATTAARGRTP